MVDAERLRRVLQRVSDDLGGLEAYGRLPAGEVLGDPARLGHVKYLFVTAVEGCVDAAHHVAASEGWRPPDSNADAFAVLCEHGVLDEDLAGVMAAGARFRNLLVHGYARIDDERVVAFLDRVADLRRYVEVVSRLA